MRRIASSTSVFVALRRGGARTIEVFAARHHFDYTDRSAVREIAQWFRSNEVTATLHQPLYADAQWSRHVAPTLNLIDVEKARRIDAMDEVKRALEAAEQIPFVSIVLHLGVREDHWSPRSLEHSLTAIEHLKAFAHPLGVKVLLENLHNEVATPEHLMEVLKVGHLNTVGVARSVSAVRSTALPFIAAASSPFAPPNCSRSILPKRGSGSSTRTVYISFLT